MHELTIWKLIDYLYFNKSFIFLFKEQCFYPVFKEWHKKKWKNDDDPDYFIEIEYFVYCLSQTVRFCNS